jgi:hypothetical protein
MISSFDTAFEKHKTFDALQNAKRAKACGDAWEEDADQAAHRDAPLLMHVRHTAAS